MKSMIIGIDFDGTCVTHEFPDVGKEIGAERVLKRLVSKGHRLILFTMRSDVKETSTCDPTIKVISGNHLTDAVKWFSDRNIPLWGINENPEQKTWTTSPKAYCNMYIDDAALGCPLTYKRGVERPFINWNEVERLLIERRIL